jgi:2-phosphosulfolactate phosphatase
MQIKRVDLMAAAQARGVVIVIDVIRAFTVAGYAFEGGARGLWLVRQVEEALALQARQPGALLAGEVDGRLIPGFDHNNSPSLMALADVRGRLLIQRTGAGTQGAVNATNATHLLLCSLTNARATAAYARTLVDSTGGVITLLPTAHIEWLKRTEDDVCADYVEALLLQRDDTADVLNEGIAYLHAAKRFDWFSQDDSDNPFEDIAAVLASDRFDFAMVGERKQWGDIPYVEVRRVDV